MDLYNKKKIEEEDYEIQEFELNMTKDPDSWVHVLNMYIHKCKPNILH